MPQPSKTIPAALAVVWLDTPAGARFLVTQRAPGRRFAGLWEWPGGKIEAGESAPAAACRELLEETGVQADPSQACLIGSHLDPGPPAIHFTIVAMKLDHQQQPQLIACSDAQWLSLRAALALPFPPANAPLTHAVIALDRSLATMPAPSARRDRRDPAA